MSLFGTGKRHISLHNGYNGSIFIKAFDGKGEEEEVPKSGNLHRQGYTEVLSGNKQRLSSKYPFVTIVTYDYKCVCEKYRIPDSLDNLFVSRDAEIRHGSGEQM